MQQWDGVAPFVRLAARCDATEAGAALRLHHLRLCASVAAYSLSDADALLLLRAARVAGTTGLAAAAAAAPAAATAAITYDSADADVDADGGADDAASLRTTLTAAESAAEAQLRLEVQMQLLFVIGVVAERPAPPAYFSFDGSGVLPLPPVTHFPSARTGFTLSFWLRLDALPPTDDDVPVLLLPAPGGGRLFEIALQRRAADSSNALPLRACSCARAPARRLPAAATETRGARTDSTRMASPSAVAGTTSC